jgi:hypothetical protein
VTQIRELNQSNTPTSALSAESSPTTALQTGMAEGRGSRAVRGVVR